ncbi:hypothetical protein LH612_36865, partial [Klebsiella pneumoniae]|nr:hypothetical protein [Klebsiella pneumoniae]
MHFSASQHSRALDISCAERSSAIPLMASDISVAEGTPLPGERVPRSHGAQSCKDCAVHRSMGPST